MSTTTTKRVEYGTLMTLEEANALKAKRPGALFLCFQFERGLADKSVLDVNVLGNTRCDNHTKTHEDRVNTIAGQIEIIKEDIANASPNDPRIPGWLKQAENLEKELAWHTAAMEYWGSRMHAHGNIQKTYLAPYPTFPG